MKKIKTQNFDHQQIMKFYFHSATLVEEFLLKFHMHLTTSQTPGEKQNLIIYQEDPMNGDHAAKLWTSTDN